VAYIGIDGEFERRGPRIERDREPADQAVGVVTPGQTGLVQNRQPGRLGDHQIDR
jgi:hypothetical protein